MDAFDNYQTIYDGKTQIVHGKTKIFYSLIIYPTYLCMYLLLTYYLIFRLQHY